MSSIFPTLSGTAWLDTTGLFMVLIGVSGEFALRRRKPLPEIKDDDLETIKFEKRKLELRRNRWQDIWECMLIIGLALELIALPGNLSEVARLNVVAEKLRSTNLVLQAQVLELGAKIQPRTITTIQVTNFILLTERIPKIAIKIVIRTSNDETENFAVQVRSMLTQAGYGTPTNAGSWGIDRALNAFTSWPIGYDEQWPFVFWVTHGTNNVRPPKQISAEMANGIVRPIVKSTNVEDIYEAISFSLNQIGIPTKWMNTANWANPDECIFFIPQKNN